MVHQSSYATEAHSPCRSVHVLIGDQLLCDADQEEEITKYTRYVPSKY